MRNSSATLSMVLTLLGGALAAGVAHRSGMAGDLGIPASFAFELEDESQLPVFPGQRPQDEIGPAPLADVTPMEEAGYFGTSPVEEDLESATMEEAPALPDPSQPDRAPADGSPADESPAGTSPGTDSQESYRFEYPDDQHGDEAQPDDEADFGPWDYDDGEDSENGYEDQYAEEPEESESADYGYESDEDFGYDFEKEYEYDFDEEDGHDYEDEVEPYADGENVSEYEAELDRQLEEESREGFEYDTQEPFGYEDIDAGYYEYEFYGEEVGPATVPEYNSELDRPESAEADGGTPWQPEWRHVPQSGLELFAPHPAELLAVADQEILGTLAALCEEPSAARRAAFHNHLEGLGLEAIDFVARFEEVTGIEVLGLADDLPGAAAFLAAFRLARQGELGMNEAIHLSERSLQRPSWSWIEGVDEITAEEFEDWYGPQDEAEVAAPDWSDATLIDNPVVDVMVSLASRSLAGAGGAVRSIARRLAELDWPSLSFAPVEGRAAGQIDPRGGPIQR